MLWLAARHPGTSCTFNAGVGARSTTYDRPRGGSGELSE